MYTHINYRTKKALKEAVANGEKVTIFQPGPFGGNEPKDGREYVEGPHEYHTWYATVELKNGFVVKVK